MKKIIISVINYNNQKQTEECLESLSKLKTDGLDVETIVIDNASKEPFINKTKSGGKISILYQKNNSGFAGGHNIGIRYAREKNADYILVLNNDTILDPNLLKELLAPFGKDNKIAAVAPKIYFTKGHEFHKDRYNAQDLGKVIWYAGGKMDWDNIYGKHIGVDEVDRGQFGEEKETELFTGCCVLLKIDVFKKLELFDERYFLYYEDADLSMRVRKAGFSILYNPNAILWHSNAGSTGGSGSPLQDYFITRNRMLFGMSYATLNTKLALIKESVKILFTGRKTQRQGIRDYYLGNFGKGSYLK